MTQWIKQYLTPTRALAATGKRLRASAIARPRNRTFCVFNPRSASQHEAAGRRPRTCVGAGRGGAAAVLAHPEIGPWR